MHFGLLGKRAQLNRPQPTRVNEMSSAVSEHAVVKTATTHIPTGSGGADAAAGATEYQGGI
jgi:hypothetical protein